MLFRPAGASLAALLVLTACGGSSGGQATGPIATPVVQTNVERSPLAVSASPSAASPIQIAQVQIRQDDTTIQIQNTGGSNAPSAADLNGWVLQVGTTSVTLPAGTRVPPGQNLVIHAGPAPTGSPSPAPTSTTLSATQTPIPTVDVYLGPSGAALRDALRPGSTLQLLDPKTVILSQYTLP